MDYGFGKTYVLPNKFTALNGTIQYYKLTASVDLAVNPKTASVKENAEAQANLLRVLETLRTYGGQPVITKVDGKEVHFTLEQANVYGNGGLHAEIHGDQQVSKKMAEVDGVPGWKAHAEAKIAELFTNVKSVVLKEDAKGHIIGEDFDAGVDLFKSVEVKEAF